MIHTLQYNDLGFFLTEKDIQDVLDMPTPNLHQAKEVRKTWERIFGVSELKRDSAEAMREGLVWFKLHKKVYDCYPELYL